MNATAKADLEFFTLKFERGGLRDEELKQLYEGILLPRMIEEKMLSLLRQGRISKWFAGIGQEAIAVGSTMALKPDEFILPMHRNLGVFTSRNIPLKKLFLQWQGKAGGFTKARDRSFHFGSREHHIVGMISHLGPQLGVADGIALGELLEESKKCTLVFSGDGGSSEGDFHEALNVASVWKLPVIFMIENNGYGLSTPVSEQYHCKRLVDRAQAYGMRSLVLDGNNIPEVYRQIKKLAGEIRENPEPILVEAITFRMRGHEEASGTKYVPKELLEKWARKDPVENYERYLLEEGILSREERDAIRKRFKSEINEAWKAADAEPEIEADEKKELNDVYAPFEMKARAAGDKKSEKRYVDAISDALGLAMEKHPKLILMGQDIAEYGGVFKITEGFLERFGRQRVRNTPLCESAILGAGLGLSVKGYKAMVEMQFADFVSSGFNQIVNNLAKSHYRWGQNADVVVRMPTGAGVGAGPFHSQSNEAWFFHTPGLKIFYPATPADAKGLLLTAFEDPNPVMFFEHKALYRSIHEEVPEGYYTIEAGKAKKVKSGIELSIITYGAGVHWALEEARNYPEGSLDILDLRSLQPLDWDAVYESVGKTGKALVLHEDNLSGGIGAEIAARISEHCFEKLDGPVMRIASLDTPVPFARKLEMQYLPQKRFAKALSQLFAY